MKKKIHDGTNCPTCFEDVIMVSGFTDTGLIFALSNTVANETYYPDGKIESCICLSCGTIVKFRESKASTIKE